MDATETPVDDVFGESFVGESFVDGLASRLSVIDDQPLDERALAYTELHDQLRDRLERGDLPAAAHR